jgi:hypothetical protein
MSHSALHMTVSISLDQRLLHHCYLTKFVHSHEGEQLVVVYDSKLKKSWISTGSDHGKIMDVSADLPIRLVAAIHQQQLAESPVNAPHVRHRQRYHTSFSSSSLSHCRHVLRVSRCESSKFSSRSVVVVNRGNRGSMLAHVNLDDILIVFEKVVVNIRPLGTHCQHTFHLRSDQRVDPSTTWISREASR